MIVIEFVFDAAPETLDEMRSLAQRTATATHREEGCILYRFTTDLQIPHRFVLTELWESEDALRAHFAGEAFKSFWAELPPGCAFVSNRAWQGSLVPYTPPSPT